MSDRESMILLFGDDGNAAPYLGEGWSHAEEGFRWTIGFESRIRVPVADLPLGDLAVEIELQPNVRPPHVNQQRLFVTINDETVQTVVALPGRHKLVFALPARVRRGRAGLDIVLRHPDAMRPAEYDATTDGRQLAFCLYRLLLRRRPGEAAGDAPDALPIPGEDDLVPPAELLFDGSVTPAEFRAVGEGFTRVNLVERGRLKPHERVLDVGSGNGQKARALTLHLNTAGSYDGVDIVRAGIEWCQAAYAAYPNFRFHHADIVSSHYNPKGAVHDDGYVFPFVDERFDLVFLSSVFTHMLPPGVGNYIREIARVLRPGGRMVATFFLLTRESERRLERGETQLKFGHPMGGCRVLDVKDPSLGVALDETWVRTRLREAGLRTTEMTFGQWSGGEDLLGAFQDVVIAVKG